MRKQLGPLQAWQWGAIIGGALILYWLYKKYQASGNTSSQTSTDSGNLLPTNGTQGLNYATNYTDPFTDPATGQSYLSELISNAESTAAQQSATTTALQNLTSTISDMQHTTATVPTPTITVPPSVVNLTIDPYTPPAPTPPSPKPPTPTPPQSKTVTYTATYIHSLPIAQQIAMVKGGAISKNLLGPNALKIYNAGGISTQYPTSASLKTALPPTALFR
jgi:hypothetical protein